MTDQIDQAEATEGVAGSRTRRPAAEVSPPTGRFGWLRYLWAVLTSMRTAILLLFALAIGSIPGGLLPQRPVDPLRVRQWMIAHPWWGRVFDALGFFDVFAQPWFAAIYLLLFISLIGCILPRTSVYLRAMRAEAAAPPRPPSRMASVRTGRTAEPVDDVLGRAQASLRGYRTRRIGDVVAAERGYLREAGNLIFHIALIGVLISIGWGSVFGYRGSAVVVEGHGFSNSLSQFDNFTAGAGFRASGLEAFTLVLDAFHVSFETGAVQTGQPREFRGDVTVTDAEGTRSQSIEVNHPVRLQHTAVHLIGHGYAPVVTVRDGNGDVAFSGPVVFLPQDANMTSLGVINVRDARPQRLAFEGIFLPTAVLDESGPQSVFPDALNPELFLNAWSGGPATETGVAQSVYTLDTTGLTQVSADGSVVSMRLAPGETYILPDSLGTVTLDGWQRWAKLQVSSTPGMWMILAWIVVAVAGMAVSLSVRPRRLWVQAEADEQGTVVHVAGLDRADGRSRVGHDRDRLLGVLGIVPGEPRNPPSDEKEN